MLPALSPAQTLSGSDGRRSGQPGLPHPVAQVERVAAVHQQRVGLLDPGDPPLLVEAGQRGELQHAQGLPPQLGHRRLGSCPLMKRQAMARPA